MIEPNDLLLFARVVETGSFSRAAERLKLPKSTVSRRLAELERQLGERLLTRTTRKLSVTDFGMSVLDHARVVADEVDGATALALHRQARPSGKLRVSMPGDFAAVALAGMLSRFRARIRPSSSNSTCRRAASTWSAKITIWRSAWATWPTTRSCRPGGSRSS